MDKRYRIFLLWSHINFHWLLAVFKSQMPSPEQDIFAPKFYNKLMNSTAKASQRGCSGLGEPAWVSRLGCGCCESRGEGTGVFTVGLYIKRWNIFISYIFCKCNPIHKVKTNCQTQKMIENMFKNVTWK